MVSVGVRRDVLAGEEDISISETAKVSLCTTPLTGNCHIFVLWEWPQLWLSCGRTQSEETRQCQIYHRNSPLRAFPHLLFCISPQGRNPSQAVYVHSAWTNFSFSSHLKASQKIAKRGDENKGWFNAEPFLWDTDHPWEKSVHKLLHPELKGGIRVFCKR